MSEFDENEEYDNFDDLDEPTPKRKLKRPAWVSLFIIPVCLYFVWGLKADLEYYLAESTPKDLGEVVGFTGEGLTDGTYVSVTGIRNPSKGIKLNSMVGDKNLFQLMGTKLIFVETKVEEDKKLEGLEVRTFSGRLFHLKNVDYFPTVREFSTFNFGVDISSDAVMIRVGEKPEDMWYMILAYIAFGLIILANIVLVIRRLTRQDQ